MSMRAALKGLGFLLLRFVLVAVGYWLGQSKSNSHSPSATEAQKDMSGMPGMAMPGMSSGEIGVSPEKQEMMGIRTTLAEVRPFVKKIRTVGVVTFDETRVAQVFTKVDGWIEQLFVNYTGKLVGKKQPLFTLYSPDLVATQDEYLLALQAEESLASSSLRDVRAGAASLVAGARRRLSLWDISEDQIDELQKTRQPKRTMTIYSPISGFVIKKEAFQGMKVMPDKELYTIADLSTVWVNADIYEFELPYIRTGQKATITLSYFPGRTFSGRVSWIAPVLDEVAREEHPFGRQEDDLVAAGVRPADLPELHCPSAEVELGLVLVRLVRLDELHLFQELGDLHPEATEHLEELLPVVREFVRLGAVVDDRSVVDSGVGLRLETRRGGAVGGQPDRSNICTNCHAGKKNHNLREQDVQCVDCHGAHVEFDPNDPNLYETYQSHQPPIRNVASRSSQHS